MSDIRRIRSWTNFDSAILLAECEFAPLTAALEDQLDACEKSGGTFGVPTYVVDTIHAGVSALAAKTVAN